MKLCFPIYPNAIKALKHPSTKLCCSKFHAWQFLAYKANSENKRFQPASGETVRAGKLRKRLELRGLVSKLS